MKKSKLLSLLVILGLILISCNKEDDPPEAAFSMDKTTAHVGETVTFINLSLNAGMTIWYFGDGTNDPINKNPTHSYSSAGSYTITLTVIKRSDSNSKKGADNASKTILITQ
jgi:PKD repeat protein